jgi:hypothetical protein
MLTENIDELKKINDIKFTFDEWTNLNPNLKQNFKPKVLIFKKENNSWSKIWIINSFSQKPFERSKNENR